MGGLILLFAVGVWIGFAIWLSIWLYRRTQGPRLKAIVKWCAFPVILLLPLGDEIVGEVQLRYLCSQGAVVHVDEERARGAELTLKYDPETLQQKWPDIPSRKVPWTALGVTEGSIELYVSGHDQVVIHFKQYSNGSSFLSSRLNNSRPAFASDGCPKEDYPQILQPILDRLNAKIINVYK